MTSPARAGGGSAPRASTFATGLHSFGTALLTLAGGRVGPPGGTAPPPTRVPYALILVFALLAAGILAVGGLYFRSDARRYRAEVERQLSTVADLKASELTQWRSERLGDASVFLGNTPFSALVRRVIDYPQDAAALAQLRTWLTKVQAHYQYDQVSLLDAQGAERLAAPEGRASVSSAIAKRVAEVLRSHEVSFADFYRNEHDGRIYLSVLVPILDEQDRALGVVELRIDPETYLYPLINRWPTPARTAEAVLIRRDGNDALILNELKFQKGTALTLRVSLSSQEVAAVKAVLGQHGIVEASDYRKVPVMAALWAVAGSPWFLVARMDAAEVNSPLRERLWVMIFLVGGLLAAAAAGVGLIWREQRIRDIEERYETEQERAWLHDVVARSLNEIYVFDPETLRFRFANVGACRNLGYTQEELVGLTPPDIAPEFTAQTLRTLLEPLRVAGQAIRAFESVHRRKDGTLYPVEVHLQLVDSGAGAVVLCLINDITERRRAETRIRHLNRMYAVLSDINQAIVRMREPQALFAEACRIAVETGGFKMAWIGLLDAQANRVRPVAYAGVTDGYLEKLQIGPGEGPRGLGPTGSALLEGRHDVSNDIEHDPRMAPWRDDALALGYRASAAFPLTVKGETMGAFNLYASEPGFFDDEELRLLDEMAMDLSLAIEMARIEEVRRPLATAIEQSPVSVVMTDADGRIEYVNPAFTRITGYASEEALGGNPRMLKSGKQEKAVYQELWTTIRAGASWRGELVNRRKDGSLYTQDLTIAPVRDAAGRVTHFVAISQDVSERKKDEQALRLARFSLDHAADMIAWVDRRGRLIYANEAAVRLTGYTGDELLGLSLWQLSLGISAEAWPRMWEATRQAGSVALGDTGRKKDGSTYSIDVVVTHVAFGETELQCAIIRDTSERQRVLQALRESTASLKMNEQRLAVALSGVDMAVFSQDRDLVYTWMFRPQLGLLSGQVVGRTDAQLLPQEAARQTTAIKRRVLETGVAARGEVSVALSDGMLHYDLVVEPVRDEDGQVVGITGASLDITEHKRAEETLRASLHEKEALLKEVHHRVKNNLQVITSLLRLESNRIHQPAVKAVIKDMQNRIQAMAVLHETLYRSDNLAQVDLGAYLRQLAGQLRRSLLTDLGKVEVHLDLVSVGLDMDQAIPCGLIANELISNALKHAFPDGRSGAIWMDLRPVGGDLALSVRDDGIGLPAGFEATRNQSLGLQLVSDLARQLGGRLHVGPGPGARFEVIFAPNRK